MTVQVANRMSDFTQTVRLELRSAVATQASVDVSFVKLDVTPWVNGTANGRRNLQSSAVELTFTIACVSAAAAATTVNALGAHFLNPTTASTFLTTSSYTATVLTIARAPIAAYPPPPPPAPQAHEPEPFDEPLFRGLTPVVIGIIAGVLGAVLACALGYACFRALFSRDEVSTGSLERNQNGRSMGLSAPAGDALNLGVNLGVTAGGRRTSDADTRHRPQGVTPQHSARTVLFTEQHSARTALFTKMRTEVLQARRDLPPPTLHTLVRAADEASQEATAALAAAMTTASNVNETPVPRTFLWKRTVVATAAAKVAEKTAEDKADKAAKADKAVMSHLLQLDPTALEVELRSLGEINLVSVGDGSWGVSVAPGGPPWQLLDSGEFEAAKEAEGLTEGLAELRAVLRLFTRELETPKHADHDYERMQTMLRIFLRLVQARSASERQELAPLLQALHKVQRSLATVHKALKEHRQQEEDAEHGERDDEYRSRVHDDSAADFEV